MGRRLGKYEAENVELKKEIARLRKELEQRKIDLITLLGITAFSYILMSDNFTLRRRMEVMQEQINILEEQLAVAKERGDRYRRGLKNLQKWLEIDGYDGAKIFGDTINRG